MKSCLKILFLLTSFSLLIACSNNSISNENISLNSTDLDSLSTISNNDNLSNSISDTISYNSESNDSNNNLSDIIPIEKDIFISEFFNITYDKTLNPLGGNSDKAIELYNPLDTSIDLNNYSLICYSNGLDTPKSDDYIINLSGVINANSTYVIAQNYACETIKGKADLILNTQIGLPIGAKSALGLYKNNVLIDVFGTIGRSYSSNDEFIINNVPSAANVHNVIRLPHYTNNTKFVESEWEVRFDNDFKSLGIHNFDGSISPISPSEKEDPSDVLFELIYNISETPHVGDINFPKEYKGYTLKYDFSACSYYYDENGKLKVTPEDGFIINFFVSIYDDGKLIETSYDAYFYYKIIKE